MKFIDAMRALALQPKLCRAYRPHGPSIMVDRLGRLTQNTDCLYLGDILDLDDWTVGRIEQ